MLINFPTELNDNEDPDEDRIPYDTDRIPLDWEADPHGMRSCGKPTNTGDGRQLRRVMSPYRRTFFPERHRPTGKDSRLYTD